MSFKSGFESRERESQFNTVAGGSEFQVKPWSYQVAWSPLWTPVWTSCVPRNLSQSCCCIFAHSLWWVNIYGIMDAVDCSDGVVVDVDPCGWLARWSIELRSFTAQTARVMHNPAPVRGKRNTPGLVMPLAQVCPVVPFWCTGESHPQPSTGGRQQSPQITLLLPTFLQKTGNTRQEDAVRHETGQNAGVLETWKWHERECFLRVLLRSLFWYFLFFLVDI